MITIKLKDNSRLFLEEGEYKGNISHAQQLIQAFCNEPHHSVFVTGYGLDQSIVHINDEEFRFGKPGILLSSMLKWCCIKSTNSEDYDEEKDRPSLELRGISVLGLFAKKDQTPDDDRLKNKSLPSAGNITL